MSSDKALKYDSACKHIQVHVLHISKKGRKRVRKRPESHSHLIVQEKEYDCLLGMGKEKKLVCSKGRKVKDLEKLKRKYGGVNL